MRTRARGTRSRSPRYLGKSDGFDQSITDFSERYADQNEKDYKAFVKAIRSGRLHGARGRLTAQVVDPRLMAAGRPPAAPPPFHWDRGAAPDGHLDRDAVNCSIGK